MTTEDNAQILASLPLRPRPALCIDPGQDETGHLLVLERPEDPEDGDAIIGLAIHGDDGGPGQPLGNWTAPRTGATRHVSPEPQQERTEENGS